MDISQALALDAYNVKFDAVGQGLMVCTIHAYGQWRAVNGKQARETFSVSSGQWESAPQAYSEALGKLERRNGRIVASDLDDLLG